MFVTAAWVNTVQSSCVGVVGRNMSATGTLSGPTDWILRYRPIKPYMYLITLLIGQTVTVISGRSRNVRKGGGRRCGPTFSSWGVGGRCKPHGVRGRAPEANAFWQQSIENWLKIRSMGR